MKKRHGTRDAFAFRLSVLSGLLKALPNCDCAFVSPRGTRSSSLQQRHHSDLFASLQLLPMFSSSVKNGFISVLFSIKGLFFLEHYLMTVYTVILLYLFLKRQKYYYRCYIVICMPMLGTSQTKS